MLLLLRRVMNRRYFRFFGRILVSLARVLLPLVNLWLERDTLHLFPFDFFKSSFSFNLALLLDLGCRLVELFKSRSVFLVLPLQDSRRSFRQLWLCPLPDLLIQ